MSAVEKVKASVDKNATPQQKAEAATKWATDAMVNQADAEKKAKAAKERAITAQKQDRVSMKDTKLAEIRADNAERKNLEFKRRMEIVIIILATRISCLLICLLREMS